MITVNNYFDTVYLINLKRRPDRLAQAQKRLEKVGVQFELIEAVDAQASPEIKAQHEAYLAYPINDRRSSFYDKKFKIKSLQNLGALGLLLTWEEILKDAIKQNHQSILIVEDDIIPQIDFQAKFNDFISQLGEQPWKVLLLGANQRYWTEPDHLTLVANKNYYYPKHTHGGFAVGLNQSIYKELLSLVQNFNSPTDAGPFQAIYHKYFGECYVAFPNLAIQDLSTSDIGGSRNLQFYAHAFKWNLPQYDYP